MVNHCGHRGHPNFSLCYEINPEVGRAGFWKDPTVSCLRAVAAMACRPFDME